MDKLFITKNAQSYRLCILCFLLLLLSNCVQKPLYEQNNTIPNHSWSAENILELEITIPENNQSYDVFLNLRHTSKYALSNVSLLVQETGPKEQEKTYRIKLPLAMPDGRWNGIGTGNAFSHQVRFLKNHNFPDTGIYRFRIKHTMKINPLPEILDVGIRIFPLNGKVIASK